MKARVTEGWERLFAAAQEREGTDGIEEEMRSWNTMVRVPAAGYEEPGSFRRRVEEMVDAVGRLSVTTFHSFCARILRTFPAEAGVDPLFEVLPEGEAADAWNAAFRLFLRGEFGGPAVSPEWERILMKEPDAGKVWGVIRRLCMTQRDLLKGEAPDFGSPVDFRRYLRAEYLPHVEYFRAFVAGIQAPDEDPAAGAFRSALPVLEAVWAAVSRGDLAAAAAGAAAGEAAFDFDLRKSLSKKKFPRPAGPPLSEVRDALRKLFRLLLEEVPDGDAAARFLFSRAGAALAAYERTKGSGLDFMDLLLRADALLSSNPEVARRLSTRFRYIFVDEFQDTDPLQAEVLRVLSAGGPPGRLFVVGDPKQSIYGFRRADIQVYRKFRKDMVDAGGEDVPLSRNFRSRPDLLATLNGMFGRILSARGGFLPGVRAHRPAPVRPRRGAPGHAVRAGPRRGRGGRSSPAWSGGIVGAVKVRGEDGKERPARLRDIAVLYRSDASGEVLSGYRNALSAAGIPNVVPSRKGFFLRQEIQDFRIVLSAVDIPADLSARHAALKTIFFGLSDEEILPLYGKDPPSVPAPREGRARPPVPPVGPQGAGLAPGPGGAALPRDGRRLRGGAAPGRGAHGAEPVEGGGDGARVRVGGAGLAQALPRGDPPEDLGRPGRGRGAGLRGGRGRRPPLHHPRGEGAGVPGRDPGRPFPRGAEGAAGHARGPGPRALRPDLPGLPHLLRLPAGAARRPSPDLRAVGAGKDGGGGAAPPVRRRHPGEGPAVPAGRGEGEGERPAGRPPGGGRGRASPRRRGDVRLLTGLAGRRVRLGAPAGDGSLGGELLRVEVSSPLPEEPRPAEAPALPPLPAEERGGRSRRASRSRAGAGHAGRAVRPGPREAVRGQGPPRARGVPSRDVPVAAEGRRPSPWSGRRGRRSGGKGSSRPSGPRVLFRELCSARLVGTELPLLGFPRRARHGGPGRPRRARVGRAERGRKSTGWSTTRPDRGNRSRRSSTAPRCGSIAPSSPGAWGVPVRGFLWYVESGESVEVT